MSVLYPAAHQQACAPTLYPGTNLSKKCTEGLLPTYIAVMSVIILYPAAHQQACAPTLYPFFWPTRRLIALQYAHINVTLLEHVLTGPQTLENIKFHPT